MSSPKNQNNSRKKTLGEATREYAMGSPFHQLMAQAAFSRKK